MNKILSLSGLLLIGLSGFSYSNITGVHSEASGNPNQLSIDVDDSKLPQPDSGVQIVPLSETYPVQQSKKDLMASEKSKKTGFIELKSYDAIGLLKISKNKYYPNLDDSFYKSNAIHDTHLKQSPSQIHLAFNFVPLSFLDQKNVIGFAAASTYKDGWTGVVEYFNDKSIGVCSYLKHNAKLNHSGIKLSKESIVHEVNGKPAIDSAEGRDKDGYAYIISWYDNAYFHTLTCANKSFSLEKKIKLLDLAKKIDLDQN